MTALSLPSDGPSTGTFCRETLMKDWSSLGVGVGGGGVLDGFRVSRVVGLHVNYEAA